MRNPIELPAPDDAAQAHSARLAGLIAARIRAAGGWLEFSEYMDLALYAPGLGYYSAGAAKFGPAGDFVTAPEISPLFGRCLANACAPWLRSNPGAAVLELGAGSGALAAELLVALERAGTAPVRYLILEVSAELRARQQERLARLPPALAARVQWLDALPPEPLAAIVIANEVADALPVSRFVRGADGIRAEGVSLAGAGFARQDGPAGEALQAAVAAIEADLGGALPEGYRSEWSPRLAGWIRALAEVLAEGVMLVADYGGTRREVYHPERRDGTLACHYRHRVHADPWVYPGLQDITAWVDFSALAEAARTAGLEVQGYATQAHFLLDTGIGAELAAATATAGAREHVDFSRQARLLLLPGEMGERFKVMALGRPGATLAGFGFRDLRHLL
jgi:SAM-dependent MidA family methyltransferase